MDTAKTGRDSRGISLNGSKDEVENKACTVNDARAVTAQDSGIITNSRGTLDELSNRNDTDGKLASVGKSGFKEDGGIAMEKTGKNKNNFGSSNYNEIKNNDNVSMWIVQTLKILVKIIAITGKDISHETSIRAHACFQNIYDRTLCATENAER